MQEAGDLVVLQKWHGWQLDVDFHLCFARERNQAVEIMVIGGETGAGLDPEHGAGEAEAPGQIADPRNERVVDETGNRTVLTGVFQEHPANQFLAEMLELRQVLVEVVALEVLLIEAVVEEFEADETVADGGELAVDDVGGLAHLPAEGFGGAEGDEKAAGGEEFAEAEKRIDVALAGERDEEDMNECLVGAHSRAGKARGQIKEIAYVYANDGARNNLYRHKSIAFPVAIIVFLVKYYLKRILSIANHNFYPIPLVKNKNI